MKQHKKFLVWICNILAVVFVFSLVGCAPMDNGGDSSADTSDTEIVDIAAYKAERIDELFAYCKSKLDENYYSETSYGLLLDCLQESVKDINAADDIANIDSICQNVKTEIDGMDTIEVLGVFYTLQEAYDNGYITVADLQMIAQEIRCDIDVLPPKIINSVKNLFCNELRLSKDQNDKLLHPNANVNDITENCIRFYGEYSGVYCFKLWNPYAQYPNGVPDGVGKTIGGVFIRYDLEEFVIWKQ